MDDTDTTMDAMNIINRNINVIIMIIYLNILLLFLDIVSFLHLV